MTIYVVWWGLVACTIILGSVAIFRAGRPGKKMLKRNVSVLDSRHAPLVVYRSSWVLRSGKGRR
jgi:hypothetical protein